MSEASGLLKLFPPPKFLEMPSVGLDLSDNSVRFIDLARNKETFSILRHAREALPKGAIVGGEIKNPAALTEKLKTFKEKHDLHFVRTALPEEKAYLFMLELPRMPHEEIGSAIQFRLEENVPIEPQNAMFDYCILKHVDTVSPKALPVAVSVFDRSLIDQYVAAFLSAGLVPLSFELESQAVARSIIPHNNPATTMIVDFGQTRTTLAMANGHVISFTSAVEMGGRMITSATREHTRLCFEDAERMKRDRGLIKSRNNKELYELLLEKVAVIKEAINRHYEYWHTRHESSGAAHVKDHLTKIILCGGDSCLPGFFEYLSGNVPIPVEMANVWINLFSLDEHIPDISFNDSMGYATAIGLALDEHL